MPLSPLLSARRSWRLLALLAVLAAAASLGYRHWRQSAAAPVTLAAAVYPAPRALPEFGLATASGTRFGRAQLLGHWTLLTFGFSNCPDACPTTLAELARARRALAALPRARQPEVVFVSVDPGRDTPERLAAYLPQFDVSFTGLTGDAAVLELLERAFGAVAQQRPDASGSYAVEHTSAVFLVDPAAHLAAVFPAPQSAPVLAADYRAILAARDPS